MKKIPLIFLTLLPTFVCAENEMDGWYVSQKNRYLVREMVYGKLYAEIAHSKSQKIRFYINAYDADCIKKVGTGIISHQPLYINKKLVRMSQYCDGNEHIYYPSTDEGNEYVINQFKARDSVEIKTHDESVRFVFSAKNFKSIYFELNDVNAGI